nr:class I SAM-dependent methyltransferase [Okeania sp. SIO2C2]
MLDVGIGTGLLTEEMLQVQDYDLTGVDFSEEMLVKARRRLSDYNVKLLNLDIRPLRKRYRFLAGVGNREQGTGNR